MEQSAKNHQHGHTRRTSSGESPASSYICPMHPEVREDGPAACPKCGMALEPETPTALTRTQYTCPMHPQIVRDQPGECPICGMALEPMTVTLEEEENPELLDMTRRFWVSVALAVPLAILAIPPPTKSLLDHVLPAPSR